MLEGIDSLPAARRDRIRASLRRDTLSQVEGSLSLRWLPLAFHIEVMERTRDEMGSVGYREFWRERTAVSLNRPVLFGKVARATIRRFSGDVFSFLKVVPKTFSYMVRDAGEMRADIAPDHGRLILDGFPAAHAIDAWADGWVGALHALAERLMEEEVPVTCEERGRADGRIVWKVGPLPS